MKFSSPAARMRRLGATSAKDARRRLSRQRPEPEWRGDDSLTDPEGWQLVTILRPLQEVAPGGQLPAPLAALSDLIEVRLSPAPGDRGTEVAARGALTGRPDPSGWKGENPNRQIRLALLRTKQLLEVGEVLLVEPQPIGKRRKSAHGLLVGLISDGADQEGVV